VLTHCSQACNVVRMTNPKATQTVGRFLKGYTSHYIINNGTLTGCGRDARYATLWTVELGKWVPTCKRCQKSR
jgi:hypothetical protein